MPEPASQIVATAFWRRLDTPGHDVRRLARRDNTWRLDGTAIFRSAEGPASVAYRVNCADDWKTACGKVAGWIGVRRIPCVIRRTQTGWFLNGDRVQGLEHLADLDFGFTPATNLQQLRRIALAQGESALTPVAWFDLETGRLSELAQRYERRGETEYWYEAPGYCYRDLLELAPNGFVSLYPSLWVMV